MTLTEDFKRFLAQIPDMVEKQIAYQRSLDQALTELLPKRVREIPVDWWMKKL